MSLKKTAATILVFICLGLYFRNVEAANVVFVIDTSGSMKERNRMQAAKEGAKLAVALLDGNVSVISFESKATKYGSPIELRSSDDRLRAMRIIDSLKADGGTNYPAALNLMKTYPTDTIFLFISDGENQEGTPNDVYALLKGFGAAIHTVGAETNSDAQSLLKQMASRTGGSFTQVDSPQELTERLVEIAQRLTQYRSYQPTVSNLTFQNCQGGMIAIGYSAVPLTQGAGHSLFHHRASLVESVVVNRHNIGKDPCEIHISIGEALGSRARIARILLEGLPMDVLQIPPDAAFATGSTIDVNSIFNKSVDRNTRIEFSVIDPSSKRVISSILGSAVSDRRIGGKVEMPSAPGTYTIRSTSHVDVNGHDFTREQERTIQVVPPQYSGLGALPPIDFGIIQMEQQQLLGTITIPSVDSTRVSYAVKPEMARMTDDKNVQVKIQTDCETISPTQSEAARVSVTADTDQALPGQYVGRLLLTSQNVVPRQTWTQDFQFRINEPLHVEDVDLGVIVVGRSVSGKLHMRNDSSREQFVEIELGEFKTNGGSIVSKLENDRLKLMPNEKVSIGISAVSNPNILDRGIVVAPIRLRINGKSLTSVQLKASLAERQSIFEVIPVEPFLQIMPGKPLRFELTLRGQLGAALPDTIKATWIPDRELDGVTVAFDSEHPIVVRDGEAAVLRGYIISRSKVSGFGAIEINSKRNGLQRIPVWVAAD